MTDTMTERLPTLADLLLASDFGRANPARVFELLDRAADPTTEVRDDRTPVEDELEAA